MKTQSSVAGRKVESATNEELLALANEGDPLHMEMAHRIRVLTVNLTQCQAREFELVQIRQYLEREIQDLGRQVTGKTVGSEDRRPNLPPYRLLAQDEIIKVGNEFLGDDGNWKATERCVGEKAPNPVYTSHRQYRRSICAECGGDHEPSGARSDCIRHWKRRAVEAENACLVNKIYGVPATIAAHENEKLTDPRGGGR